MYFFYFYFLSESPMPPFTRSARETRHWRRLFWVCLIIKKRILLFFCFFIFFILLFFCFEEADLFFSFYSSRNSTSISIKSSATITFSKMSFASFKTAAVASSSEKRGLMWVKTSFLMPYFFAISAVPFAVE